MNILAVRLFCFKSGKNNLYCGRFIPQPLANHGAYRVNWSRPQRICVSPYFSLIIFLAIDEPQKNNLSQRFSVGFTDFILGKSVFSDLHRYNTISYYQKVFSGRSTPIYHSNSRGLWTCFKLNTTVDTLCVNFEKSEERSLDRDNHWPMKPKHVSH